MPRSNRWSGLLYLGVVLVLVVSMFPSASVAELPAFVTPGSGESSEVQTVGDQPPGITPEAGIPCDLPPGQTCDDTQTPTPTPGGDSSCDVPPGQPCPGDTPSPTPDGGTICDVPPGQSCPSDQQPNSTPPDGTDLPGTITDGDPDAGRWRGGPERTGEMPGPGLDIAQEPGVLWDTPIGSGSALSAPVVANGLVYFTSGGVVYAYKAESGILAWNSEPSYNAIGHVEVIDAVLYGYSGHGWVFSINAIDGTPITAVEHPAASANSHFLVTDNLIYLAKGPGLAALDPVTLGERWSVQLPGLNANGLAASGDTVVVGVDGTILALDAANGSQRWPSPVVVSPNMIPGVTTTPYGVLQMSIADGLLYVNSTASEFVYALSLDDGGEMWRANAPATPVAGIGGYFLDAPVAVGEGVVVFPSINGHLTALNAQDHTQRWEFEATASIFGYQNQSMASEDITVVGTAEYRFPTIVDGVVYVSVWVVTITSVEIGSPSGIDEGNIYNLSIGNAVTRPIGIAAFSLADGEELSYTDAAQSNAAGFAIVDGMLIGTSVDSVFALRDLEAPANSDNDEERDDQDEPGDTGDDVSAYIDEVRAHNDELVDSADRLVEILSKDERTDADADEVAGILELWAAAPGTAASIDVPDGMDDVQAAHEDTASAYRDVVDALAAWAATDPGSRESDEAWEEAVGAVTVATDLSASLDAMLSEYGAATLARVVPRAMPVA